MDDDSPDKEQTALQRVLALAAALHTAIQRLGPTATSSPPEPEQPEHVAAAPPNVPQRILEMLRWMCHPKGYTYKEIAAKMNCHTSTLRTYRERIEERYGIKGKAALVGWAITNKLV